jgi:hypothetical protein
VNEIYDLELYEDTVIEIPFVFNKTRSITVIRVPGGWLFKFKEYGSITGQERMVEQFNYAFVPYSDEYKEQHEESD